MIGLLSLVLALTLLPGCASWKVVPLPATDAAYFQQKVETTLPGQFHVEKMGVRKGKVYISVLLLAEPHESNVDAEVKCLKIVKALSGDPSIPDVYEVDVASERPIEKPHPARPDEIEHLDGEIYVVHTATGMIICGKKDYPMAGQHEILFCCKSARDALLKGEAPKVTIRAGRLAHGFAKGLPTTYSTGDFLSPYQSK